MKTRANDCTVSTDELHRQARVWLRLLASADVTAADAEAFRRWLNTSAAHKVAFNDVKHRWAVMKPATGEYLRTRPKAAADHERALRGPYYGRRVFLGAAVSAAAVAGIAVMHPSGGRWLSPGEWGADDRTAVGEQRTLALAQRAKVMLNTQTSIRRQTASAQTSGIDLITGEVAIDLQAGGEDFGVVAGVGRCVAEAGSFEVRHLHGKVRATCIEGAMRVEHPAGVRALRARQQTVYDAASVSGIANVEPADVSAWRRGELVFNQVRLVDVLAEIDRYRAGRVVLMNDAARDNRVTGRFLLASLDAALSQLENTFDLNARLLPGGLLVLS
ncbi:FecR domain-containing protein [Cupriavidus basilensis]|uniref:FecR domain-containing protein n=1 Tax=Cupriavidus basilensis TaxID=68895 RepID=A0ABT6AY89_9BURK|nr:FecR domain-containing protein [Cupriavidus basilensis]MDF3837591.1 FecR domain-containing protein [Cupriavidus basilensis]